MRARVVPCGWEIVLRTGNKAMPANAAQCASHHIVCARHRLRWPVGVVYNFHRTSWPRTARYGLNRERVTHIPRTSVTIDQRARHARTIAEHARRHVRACVPSSVVHGRHAFDLAFNERTHGRWKRVRCNVRMPYYTTVAWSRACPPPVCVRNLLSAAQLRTWPSEREMYLYVRVCCVDEDAIWALHAGFHDWRGSHSNGCAFVGECGGRPT